MADIIPANPNAHAPENPSTMQSNPEHVELQPTGIADVDLMLGGGFPHGATILLAGSSGAGKTVLATQWLFEGLRKHNEKGVYISLTEPTSKLENNLKYMSFYREEDIQNQQIILKDLRTILETNELDDKEYTREDVWKMVDLIGNLVVETGAKRVVLDSVTAMCYRLESHTLIRHFIFSLGTTLAYLDATVIMTSEVTGQQHSIFGVEEFICDGILKLTYNQQERDVREFRIVKMRGLAFNSFPAKFHISHNGIHLYPHVEQHMTYQASNERVPTGTPGLDEMTHGGFIKASTILVSGPSGAGKSIMAQHYVNESLKRGEKAIYISFEESHSEIIRNSRSFGWNYDEYEQKGLLQIVAISPDHTYLEAHFKHAQELIDKHEIKHVVVDSLSALSSVFDKRKLYDLCKLFIAHNKHRGATTMFTVAGRSIMGGGNISDMDLSTLTDNIIMLRYIEIDSELRHGVLILKMRSSEHDRSMREVTFSDKGMSIAASFAGYEGVLSGNTRKVSDTTEEQVHALFLEILGPMGEQLFQNEKAKGLSAENITALIQELSKDGILSGDIPAAFHKRVCKILGCSDNNAQA